MYFLGIDLAWKTKPRLASPSVTLDEEGRIVFTALPKSDDDIIKLASKQKNCVIGIDAPLVVKNFTGARDCDLAFLREFGIPIYQVNRTWLKRKYGGIRGETLVSKLARLGYALTPELEKRGRTQSVLEVYPHASLRLLFGRLPRYKKGTALERKRGLTELCERAKRLDPPFDLKPIEPVISPDLFDAAMAAYTVYLHWRYDDRTLFVGDNENGFIVIPRTSP